MLVNHLEFTKEELLLFTNPFIEKYSTIDDLKETALAVLDTLCPGNILSITHNSDVIFIHLCRESYRDPNPTLLWYESLTPLWIGAIFRGGSVDLVEVTIVEETALCDKIKKLDLSSAFLDMFDLTITSKEKADDRSQDTPKKDD